MKPLAIVLSGLGRESRGGDGEDDPINVQHKSIQNCYNEPPLPLYNEYIIKIGGKKKKRPRSRNPSLGLRVSQ
jgi:hypothetical protein